MPVKLSDAPPEVGRPAPELGQHTREALAEYGLSRGEAQPGPANLDEA